MMWEQDMTLYEREERETVRGGGGRADEESGPHGVSRSCGSKEQTIGQSVLLLTSLLLD